VGLRERPGRQAAFIVALVNAYRSGALIELWPRGLLRRDQRSMNTTYEETPHERQARREWEAEQKAKELVEQLGRFVNGMSSEGKDAFATALANEHPTLLGQIAKAVGIGVMRRAEYDPKWQPFEQGIRARCRLGTQTAIPHPEHDGRLDCTTIVGAELMARQSFI
jgi:hypothetical protein